MLFSKLNITQGRPTSRVKGERIPVTPTAEKPAT